MSTYFLLSICLNIGLLVALTMITNQLKRERNRFSIRYFTKNNTEHKWMGIQKINTISYMAQIQIDNMPIGEAFTIVENKVSEVDDDRMDKLLEEYAKPLIEAGIKVIPLIKK